MGNCWNLLRNPLQDGPKSLKIELWGCLGALWRPSWPQDGSRSTPRAKNNEKLWILGCPVGSKMGPKSIKSQMKNHIDFYNHVDTTFFWYWDDFGSKNLSKMRGRRVTFSTSLRIYEKYDFEQPSYGFAIFFDFRRVDFRPQKVYFSDVFSKMLSRRIFFDFRSKLGPNWMPNGSPNRWKNQ